MAFVTSVAPCARGAHAVGSQRSCALRGRGVAAGARCARVRAPPLGSGRLVTTCGDGGVGFQKLDGDKFRVGI